SFQCHGKIPEHVYVSHPPVQPWLRSRLSVGYPPKLRFWAVVAVFKSRCVKRPLKQSPRSPDLTALDLPLFSVSAELSSMAVVAPNCSVKRVGPSEHEPLLLRCSRRPFAQRTGLAPS